MNSRKIQSKRDRIAAAKAAITGGEFKRALRILRKAYPSHDFYELREIAEEIACDEDDAAAIATAQRQGNPVVVRELTSCQHTHGIQARLLTVALPAGKLVRRTSYPKGLNYFSGRDRMSLPPHSDLW